MKPTAFPLLLCLLLISCDHGPDSSSDRHAFAFEHGYVYLSADFDKVVGDKQFTIITRCYPTITGKGWIGMAGLGQYTGSTVIVDEPLHDTQITHSRLEDNTYSIYPAEFKANEPFEQRWRIRLQFPAAANFPSGFQFNGYAIIDSIFIPDSARLYPASSLEAKRYSGALDGFDVNAMSGTFLHLNP
ncbi:MAG: hypothetical protein ABI876_04645 [Bacteroidota bacterium]